MEIELATNLSENTDSHWNKAHMTASIWNGDADSNTSGKTNKNGIWHIKRGNGEFTVLHGWVINLREVWNVLNNDKLKVKALTNDHLRNTLKKAHNNNRLKDSLASRIIENAENAWKLFKVVEAFSNCVNEDIVGAIMDDYEINEYRYSIHPFPPTWDDIYSTKKQVTAPMHTMGPGIAKNIMMMTLELATLQNKNFLCMKESGQLLDYIADKEVRLV
eukprot:11715764-Ditylum_brightwellii.AAC.1